ncbi:MAG: TIGR02444 family protein [Proteobacteria bacterium]|nr:TIGR02444 family protein [Pseudomonadota bacterium]
MASPTNAFWDFSVALWADAAVRAALLRLQDRHAPGTDVDVNLLLFCVWAAAVGHGELTNGEILGAVTATAKWRAGVVLPVRAARRSLGHGVDPVPPVLAVELRAAAADAEREADRIEQALLERLIEPGPGPAVDAKAADDAAASLARYFSHLGLASGEADSRDFGRILAAAFGSAAAGRRDG